ncbi:MAG: methyltransferase domain-containing protein [bacterium]|nr:methyltransferase domain-containing protein [bacterium]
MSKYAKFKIDLDNHESTHTRIINLVGEGKEVLDLGCASGYISQVLKEQRGCIVTGVEMDPEDAEEARKYCREVIVENLETIDFSKYFREDQFDVALFADVLEHLRNPEEVLTRLQPYVREAVVISVPNITHSSVIYEMLSGKFDYRSLGLLDSTHVHFFTRDSISDLVDNSGFIIEEFQVTAIPPERTEFNTDLSQYPDAVRNYIAALPASLDYQYVFRAQKKSLVAREDCEKNLLEQISVLQKKVIEQDKLLRMRGDTLGHKVEALQRQIGLEREQHQLEVRAVRVDLESERKRHRHELDAYNQRYHWFEQKLHELLTNAYDPKETIEQLHQQLGAVLQDNQTLRDLLNSGQKTAEKTGLSSFARNMSGVVNSSHPANQMILELQAQLADTERELAQSLRFSPQHLPRLLRAPVKTAIALAARGPLEPIRVAKARKMGGRKEAVRELYPKVAVVSLAYNSERYLKGYFDAFEKVDYPRDRISLNIIDNGSRDNSYEAIKTGYADNTAYPLKVNLFKSRKNLGFTGGNNYLLRRLLKNKSEKFVFLLNIDTEISPDCISRLVESMRQDADAGMVEAVQTPKEHPKWYDPTTLETGWCSGGGVLIRAQALREVGLFDDRYFLYCEDVDLSWRMWLQRWKCKVNPAATYAHFTEDLDGEKDPSVQRFYSIRNSYFMHYKYDSRAGIAAHDELVRAAINWEQDPKAKALLEKARREGRRSFPRFVPDRLKIKTFPQTPWVVFNGLDYEVRRPFEDTADGRRIIG